MSVEEQLLSETEATLYSGSIIRAGQRLTIPNRTVTKLAFPIFKAASPSGDVTFVIRKVSDSSIIVSKVWGNASALPTVVTWEEVTFDTPASINEEVYILVEYSGASNVKLRYYYSSDIKADEYHVAYVSSWIDYLNYDAAYKYTYGAATSSRGWWSK